VDERAIVDLLTEFLNYLNEEDSVIMASLDYQPDYWQAAADYVIFIRPLPTPQVVGGSN
jgi:hypothetical protein